ncbi:hypothetical protein [Sinorhizobium fredii]|uniref:hypothetical protein n=1 Tax=Rhizobium fredii TaxID=380 RepID=UPI003513BC44
MANTAADFHRNFHSMRPRNYTTFPDAIWVQQLAREGSGLGLTLHVRELKGLHEKLERSSNRFVLGLIASGLFVSGALLMETAGPRIFGEVPVFAAVAFALALWFTLRLLRAIARSGRL